MTKRAEKWQSELTGESIRFKRRLDQFSKILAVLEKSPSQAKWLHLEDKFQELARIDVHFQNRERLLFPMLDAAGSSDPTRKARAGYDRVRTRLDALKQAIQARDVVNCRSLLDALADAMAEVWEHDQDALVTAAVQTLDDDQWATVLDGVTESMVPESAFEMGVDISAFKDTQRDRPIKLARGDLSIEELEALFEALPLDITLVDAQDKVRFFSEYRGGRVFPRTLSALGRSVQMCHPRRSVHVVNRILREFRKGTKDHADFWITYQGRFVFIRYFAVRDREGNYLGTLEVTQDVTEIRELDGERRLLDWVQSEGSTDDT